jgi:hypothetical protein
MAYGALDPWDEQQDPFESSFFQQPQQPMSAPAPTPAAASTPSPSAQSMDPFTSSVFAPSAGGAMQGVFGPGAGMDLARRSAPRGAPAGPEQPPGDYGLSSGSSRQPPSAPTRVGSVSGASGAVVGGGSFDYGSLVDKVKASADPRERAVAQDQLARATYTQLKEAGHDVSWKDDQLVVDGRPYLVGDGASAPPREMVQDPNSTSGWLDRENALNTPPTAAPPSGKTAPTGGPGLDYYQNATGRTQGGAQTPQEAYDQLAGSLDPNASREDMEAAIEQAFGHLPGYGGAYKESVMLNGRWYDMVTGYGGAGASWGGLTPKGPSKSAASSMFGNSFLNSPLSPMGGGSGSVMGALAPKGARGVDLNLEGMNPAILALLQRQQEPQEPDPMTPSYMGLLR